MISIDKKILWCYYILTAWKYKKNPLKTKKVGIPIKRGHKVEFCI